MDQRSCHKRGFGKASFLICNSSFALECCRHTSREKLLQTLTFFSNAFFKKSLDYFRFHYTELYYNFCFERQYDFRVFPWWYKQEQYPKRELCDVPTNSNSEDLNREIARAPNWSSSVNPPTWIIIKPVQLLLNNFPAVKRYKGTNGIKYLYNKGVTHIPVNIYIINIYINSFHL